jgi:site-specific DNA-adenine methylase
MKKTEIKMIKFLPSYVGSKAYWVDKLAGYKNSDMVEVFAGSGVLSANLAKTALLNDLDPIIYKVFSNYDQLIVPAEFTVDDYFKYRKSTDWWKHIYCLQKMSFSGVFRYSKNGFNVPVKSNFKDSGKVAVKAEFEIAKKRFSELNPEVLNVSYDKVPLEKFRNKVVIFDPPYEGSQAAYNIAFDYEAYWEFVKAVSKIAKTVILFDTKENIKKAGYKVLDTRKMRVNGARPGSEEAISIIGENKFSPAKKDKK